MRGLGIERASGDWDNQITDQPTPEEMGLIKLNQIVQVGQGSRKPENVEHPMADWSVALYCRTPSRKAP
jgi:hypothetical protein